MTRKTWKEIRAEEGAARRAKEEEWRRGFDSLKELSAQEILQRTVEELNVSLRTRNCLEYAEIKTIGQLVQHQECELLRLKNFGRKSIREMREALTKLGLQFKTQVRQQPH